MQTATLTARKREAILKAALGEFEARGYRETSMDRVADSAQVSKRTVYNHFASKELLFEAIAAELIERVQKVGEYCYDPTRPVDRQLRAIGEQILQMLIAPCFVSLARVTLVELIRSPELAARTYELFRQRQTGLAGWLQAASADGRLVVDDAEWAADQFFGLIKAFAFWPQLLGAQRPPDNAEQARILDSSVAMFLAGCRVGEGAAG